MVRVHPSVGQRFGQTSEGSYEYSYRMLDCDLIYAPFREGIFWAARRWLSGSPRATPITAWPRSVPPFRLPRNTENSGMGRSHLGCDGYVKGVDAVLGENIPGT